MPQDLGDLIGRFRELGAVENPDGDLERIEVLPPASAAEREAFLETCGGRIPAELDALLSLTSGLRGPVEFEPRPEWLETESIGALLVYEYGNGDGLGIEPADETCRVWWVGHDPYFIVYKAACIADLLSDWLGKVEQLTQGAEKIDLFFGPTLESPCRLPTEVDSGSDTGLETFIRQLPLDSKVHDLRRAAAGTEIPFERLAEITKGSRIRRHGMVFAFTPPPAPSFVEPLPVAHYLDTALPDEERSLLESLPKGCLVLHQRDLAEGAKVDFSGAHPEQDISFRPPFHVLYPRPKAWWKFW